MLLPKDPNDEKNVFVEIRGGAGGENRHGAEQAGGDESAKRHGVPPEVLF